MTNWLCKCGRINDESEECCAKCGVERDIAEEAPYDEEEDYYLQDKGDEG